MQVVGFPITVDQLHRARHKCGADGNMRKYAARLKLAPDSPVCDFLCEHTDTRPKDLLPLVNAKFIGVRAAADGAGRRAVRPWRGRCGSPAGATGGVPVQVVGFPINYMQLYYARHKYDPEPTFTSDDDAEIKRLLLAHHSFEEVAAGLAHVRGISANRVRNYWHRELKKRSQKPKPPGHAGPTVPVVPWTPAEHRDVAEAAAIVADSSTYDEHHCAADDGLTAKWTQITEFVGNRRSPAAVKRRYETHLKEGRLCMSSSCSEPAAFGSRFCARHEPIFKNDNPRTLGVCAAHAEEARDEGCSVPTRPATDGAMCTDAAITSANEEAEAWLLNHPPIPTKYGTFVALKLAPAAVATGEGPTATHRTRELSLSEVARGAQPTTTDSHWTFLVATATTSDLPVMFVTKIDGVSYFVAVWPQATDKDGKVDNYLKAVVTVLCPVEHEDGPERAVAVLSAQSSRYATALFSDRLRQAFQVREGDTFKAHPCLFRYRVDPTFPWTLGGVAEMKKAAAMCPSDAASATTPDALDVLDVPCEV